MVINPDTPVDVLKNFLTRLDMVLIMSVYPGFSGQKFIESTPEKIRELKEIIDEIAPHVRIEVDGGVTDITGRLLKESGADIIVSASYIYGGNIRERIGILKNI